MGSESLDLLWQNPVCRRLRPDQLEGIARSWQGHNYRKGALLRRLPDTDTTVFLVGAGEVHRSLLSLDGREFALRSCVVGDLFALDERYPEMVAQAATKDTVVWVTPGDRFVDALRCSPEAVVEVLRLLWGEVLRQRRMLSEVVFCDVGERLAHTLAEQAGSDPQGRVYVSRAELAHFIGASAEEVTRQLHRLRNLDLIRYEPHSREIFVSQVECLRHYRHRSPDLS